MSTEQIKTLATARTAEEAAAKATETLTRRGYNMNAWKHSHTTTLPAAFQNGEKEHVVTFTAN